MVFDRATGEMAFDVMPNAALAPRHPWPHDFPEVVIHTNLGTRDGHEGYFAAKGGDAEAALSLALDLIDVDGAAERSLAAMIGHRDVLLLPVVADEAMGFNAIPDAMAWHSFWPMTCVCSG
jgi:hypothetical protein